MTQPWWHSSCIVGHLHVLGYCVKHSRLKAKLAAQHNSRFLQQGDRNSVASGGQPHVKCTAHICHGTHVLTLAHAVLKFEKQLDHRSTRKVAFEGRIDMLTQCRKQPLTNRKSLAPNCRESQTGCCVKGLELIRSPRGPCSLGEGLAAYAAGCALAVPLTRANDLWTSRSCCDMQRRAGAANITPIHAVMRDTTTP